jgi:RNA polymerase sigma-70 factor (ECF subfamily)
MIAQETITLLQQGDHSAFENLFDHYFDALCRYAYSLLKDMDEAEDSVQKTFCKLWDQREELNIHSSINYYLYRMVHNDCLNRIKQIKLHMEHNLNYTEMVNYDSDSVSEHVATSELKDAINKALEKLPPQCKKVFEMSRNEQKSYTEISNELGISNNTIENHISKALKLLRIELSEFITILIILYLMLY